MKSRKSHIKFGSEYFFQYFALGCFLPLLSIYFEGIGLSGTQIGIITSVGSFVTIFAPPFWGIVSDKSMKHKSILLGLMMVCILMFLLLPMTQFFPLILIIYTIFNLSSSALNPLMDGISLNSPIPFGKIRLWGALGFAVAAFAIGKLAEATTLSIIFYAYAVAMLITILILLTIRIDLRGHEPLHLKDIKTLLSNKTFLVFLLYTLLIAGTLGAHNVFFGLLFKEVGGDTGLIGLAFLLFAASEAPFMQIIPYFIKRYGILNMMLLAPLLGVFRWYLHSVIPDPTIHLAIFFIQGIFYAPFLIGIAEYVRSRISPHLRTSAITIYSAIGFGVGGILTNFASGLLYDHISAQAIYAFYSLLCAIAFFVMLALKRIDQNAHGKIL